MNKQKLKEIIAKYHLEDNDIFVLNFRGKSTPIVTRQGVEKIQKYLGIQVNYKVEHLSDDLKSCVVLATGVIFDNHNQNPQARPKKLIQSFGEASPANNKNSYSVCMAEKRALARVILKMADLFGIYGEDESEDFKNNG